MLARIGMKITLNAQTRLQYFAQISNPDYRTSFYMLGWTPTTYDALNSLFNLAGTRNGVRGVFNAGGWSTAEFDGLLRPQHPVGVQRVRGRSSARPRSSTTRRRSSRCISKPSSGPTAATSSCSRWRTTTSRCAT